MREVNALAGRPEFGRIAPGVALARDPLGFVDVGAQGGVDDLVSPLARHVAVLGFEPDPEAFRALQAADPVHPWHSLEMLPIALAERCGDVALHLVSASTNNSLRRPSRRMVQRYQMVKWEIVGSAVVPAIDLDTAVFERASANVRWGELLKLDTQGTEYEILDGGRRTLRERTMAVYTEVSFTELYEGQRLFSDVERLLRESGFHFYGFTTQHTRSRRFLDKHRYAGRERVIQTDAIFIRDPLPLDPNQTVSERSLYITFVCALLLGYFDFAEELALSTWATGGERQLIQSLIRDMAGADPAVAAKAAQDLADAVRAEPERANILVGKFVDERRLNCDYKDIPAR